MTDVGLEALELLTVSEVAQRLRCSAKKISRLAAAGELTRVKMGSLVRITPESVAAYKKRLIAEAEAARPGEKE